MASQNRPVTLFWLHDKINQPPFLWPNSPPVCQSILIIDASRSHSDTVHTVGLWTSDQAVAETYT